MKMRRSAPWFLRQIARSLAVAMLTAQVAHAAPPTSSAPGRKPAAASTARVPTAPPGKSESRPEASGAPPAPSGDTADAHPSNNRATPDLLLPREGERKAEALAAYAQGLLLEDAADNDAALVSFRKAFDLDSSDSELAVKLAFLLAQRNDPTGGIEVLKDNIKASPKEALPHIYLAQLYAKYLKKPEAGIKYAEQALALDAEYYPAYLALFELFAATNQPARVEQVLQRATKSPSLSAQFWLQIGGLCQQAHLKEDGTVTSPEALKQMNDFFAKAALLGSTDPLVLARVGNYYIDSGQAETAITYYQKALSLKPTSDDPVLANAGDKLARALTGAGQLEKAISVLEKVTTENPLRFETFELLGELYQQKGDLDHALANFKHSTLLDASEPRNHVRIIEMQIQMKRFDDAVETAQSARARFPESPEALYMHAYALSQAKRHTEALAIFAEALTEFESSHEEFLSAQFYFNYGATAEQAGIYDKATEMLKRSIELDPSSSLAAQASNYLGYMWVERGENLDEAGEMIRKAVALEPDNGAFLDSLGWLYFKKGDFEKALQQLQKAADLIKPEDATVLEHLGDTYQQLSRPAQALQYWQKALTLDAGNKKIGDKIEAVKQKVSANTTGKSEAVAVP